MGNNDLICQRVELWREGKNPYFIHEFKHTIFVVGDHQFYKGYSLLLLKKHVREIHELTQEEFLEMQHELFIAGKAIFDTFLPWKMNYQCLGNKDEHVHWHILPRYESDSYHKTLPFIDFVKGEKELKDYMISNSEATTIANEIRKALCKL